MAASHLGDTGVRPLAIGEAAGNFISQQSQHEQREQLRRDRRSGRHMRKRASGAQSSPMLVPQKQQQHHTVGLEELASETAALRRFVGLDRPPPRGGSAKLRRKPNRKKTPGKRRGKGGKRARSKTRGGGGDGGSFDGAQGGADQLIWDERLPQSAPTSHARMRPRLHHDKSGTPPPPARNAFQSRPSTRGGDDYGGPTIEMMAPPEGTPRSSRSESPRPGVQAVQAGSDLAQYPPGHVMTPGAFMPGGTGGGYRTGEGPTVSHGRELDARYASSHSAVPGEPVQPTSARRRRERAQVGGSGCSCTCGSGAWLALLGSSQLVLRLCVCFLPHRSRACATLTSRRKSNVSRPLRTRSTPATT